MSKVRARAKTLYLDYQGREGLTAPWMAGKKGKEMRSVLGFNPPGITFSVGHADRYRWKDSVQSAAELKIWGTHRRAAWATAEDGQVCRHALRSPLGETG